MSVAAKPDNNPLKKASIYALAKELIKRDKVEVIKDKDNYILKIPKKEVDIFE